MLLWVIYARPTDYPHHYVVRAWIVNEHGMFASGTGVCVDTAIQARTVILDAGGCMILREPDINPDPRILEVWI
jgi:hypothetical protein